MAISRRKLLSAAGVGALASVVGPVGLRSATGASSASTEAVVPAAAGPQDLITLFQTVQPGPANGVGYRKLILCPPEPHLLRQEFTLRVVPARTLPLASFVQVSDLHIVDDESPMRTEYMDQYANPGAPHFGSYPTGSAYRPQEFLSKQLVDAMCRAIRQVAFGPGTGRPLEFTIATGDVIDNVQLNETRWYIDLLDGGRTIVPTSGDPSRDQSVSEGLFFGPFYYAPEDGENSKTYFNAGFPTIPGLLSNARKPFVSTGLGMPWYTAYGNHDALVQGNFPIGTAGGELKDIAIGSSKMVDTDGFLPALYKDAVSLETVLAFVGAPHVKVSPDPSRRLLSRAQFVAEHFNTSGTPAGHGFTAGSDKAYYVMPAAGRDPIRYIVLDTTNPGGGGTFTLDGSGGSLDHGQYSWLENQLKAYSSTYSLDDSDGTRHQTVVHRPEIEDKLIVIFCHHTLTTMDLTSLARPYDGDALKKLLFRFPNVVLMVDGHTHANNIWPQKSQWFQQSQGFWEVNTASHIDWPIQSRTIEIENDGTTLSIFTTMLDIDAPADFEGDYSTLRGMASIARELSVNDIQERQSKRRGVDRDRNAQLVLPLPAPIVAWGSPLALARNTDGRMEMFGTNGADQVFHNRQTVAGGPLSPWMLFDGDLRAVAAENNADGRLEVFGVNRAGQVFHRWQTNAAGARWSPWFPLDGGLNSIAAARNGDGRLEIFGTNTEDKVFHRWQTTAGANTWTAWEQLDGQLQQLAAEANLDGRIELFGTNKEGHVFHRSQLRAGGWSSWVRLFGVPMMKSVAAARNQDGRLEILGTTSSETVWHSAQTAPNAGTWTNWSQLNGSLRWIAAQTNNAGRIELLGVDRFDTIYRATQTGANATTWSSFLPLPKLTPTSGIVPSLVGKSPTAAVAALHGAFFTPGTVKFLVDSSCQRIDDVMSQSPAAGSRAIFGSPVNYAIASAPPGGCDTN